MKLLFDENLSPRLPSSLAVEYPDSRHVDDVGMVGTPDATLWAYAAANQFVIVSKDKDFGQRALIFGHPPKVIWLRLGNCPTSRVAAVLRARLPDVLAFEADPHASLLALS